MLSYNTHEQTLKKQLFLNVTLGFQAIESMKSFRVNVCKEYKKLTEVPRPPKVLSFLFFEQHGNAIFQSPG